MKKKICIVMDKLHDAKAGGLVSTYSSLVNLLKDEYDFEIISVSNCGYEEDERFPGAKITSISSWNFYPSMRELKGYIKDKHFVRALILMLKLVYYFLYIPVSRVKMKSAFTEDDIVIVTSPASGMFMPKDVKFILEVHANYEFFWEGKGLAPLQIKLMQKPELVLFRTKTDMEKAKNVVNAGYMYNFYDNHGLPSPLVGDESRKHRIVFVGRLVEQKNPLMLIECAKELKKYYPDFKLDMYGTGPLHDAILEKIREYKLEDNVYLMGYTSDKSVYNNYSVEWLTSRFEGFGLVIIEGKACGVPTISTKWGDAVYEVIEDGSDGYIVEDISGFVKKTKELWENEDKLVEMSNQALLNFKKFSSDEAKIKWMDLLDNYQNTYLR